MTAFTGEVFNDRVFVSDGSLNEVCNSRHTKFAKCGNGLLGVGFKLDNELIAFE